MKHVTILIAAATFACGAGAAFAEERDWRDEAVDVYVDHLQPSVRIQVKKHAAEGVKSLARYMERTRPYHRLWFDDVTQPREAITALDPKVAERQFRKHAMEYR